MKEALLKGEEITKEYNGISVLQGINVEIYRGDFTVIMGSSGAGKSTLLYCLSGMDTITGGKITYQDTVLSDCSEKKMAELRAKEFGFVFQQSCLVSNLTLLENVLVAGFVSRSASEQEIREKADALLRQMHVEKAKDRLPAQASGGEAQRAAIARAMIGTPGLLFADEPTGALNRANSEEVLDLLSGLHKAGQSILMVTHDAKAALRGNRILYMEDGNFLDELFLPPYGHADAAGREKLLSDWLSKLQW